MTVFTYDPPERFVAGTVGMPGQRAFFLQARDGDRLTSVGLEKQQLTLLARRLDQMLDEVIRTSAGAAPVPRTVPSGAVDLAPLEQPVVEEFRVGTLTLGWDPEDDRAVVEAGSHSADADAEPEGTLLVRLTGAQARSFTRRALAVVAAGRPPCPLCGLPLDTTGHICPRQNGRPRSAWTQPDQP